MDKVYQTPLTVVSLRVEQGTNLQCTVVPEFGRCQGDCGIISVDLPWQRRVWEISRRLSRSSRSPPRAASWRRLRLGDIQEIVVSLVLTCSCSVPGGVLEDSEEVFPFF